MTLFPQSWRFFRGVVKFEIHTVVHWSYEFPLDDPHIHKFEIDFPLKGVPDRASIKLFTKDVLLPGAGKYPEPSQKIVSATASRYFIFWASSMIQDFMQKLGDQTTEYMKYHALLFLEVRFRVYNPKNSQTTTTKKSFVKSVGFPV